MTIDEAIEKARTDLPTDWRIVIEIDTGLYYVELYTPAGLKQEYGDNEGPIADRIINAIGVARRTVGC